MLLEFRGKKPQIHKDTWIAPNAVVAGDVTMEEGSSVFYSATVRAEFQSVRIGKYTNIQDNSVLHVAEEYPLEIGQYTTIGHSVTLHSCKIGNNVVIGMGAVILDGAEIGDNSIVGAFALITSGKKIPENSLVIGAPGKVVRQLTDEEIKTNKHNAEVYVENARTYKAEVAKVEGV